MKSGYSKALTVILIMIIVAVIGLVAYLGFDYYSRYRTNKDGEAFVDSLIEGVTVDAPEGNSTNTSSEIENITTSSNNIDSSFSFLLILVDLSEESLRLLKSLIFSWFLIFLELRRILPK